MGGYYCAVNVCEKIISANEKPFINLWNFMWGKSIELFVSVWELCQLEQKQYEFIEKNMKWSGRKKCNKY